MRVSIFLFLFSLMGSCWHTQAVAPKVVVTIKPIHSLVSGIMQGIKEPTLLMEGNISPHTHALTPDGIRKMKEAQVVVWVGPSYEGPLKRLMETLGKRQHAITLMKKPGIRVYPLRKGKLWGSHNHGGHHDHDCQMDGHIWLNPENAKAIVRSITKELSTIDPENKDTYKLNSEKVLKRLGNLDEELKKALASLKNKPYIVYHDSMQYFDRHFGTKAVGALIGESHSGVKAQHVVRISRYIRSHRIQCLFTEPQFQTDRIDPLIDKLHTRIETLDVLGIGIKADENAYFTLMRHMAYSLLKGLGYDDAPSCFKSP